MLAPNDSIVSRPLPTSCLCIHIECMAITLIMQILPHVQSAVPLLYKTEKEFSAVYMTTACCLIRRVAIIVMCIAK